MLTDSGIEDFIDDGFEGSPLERSIFREIFFGNDSGSSTKKCLVTEAINFECDSSRNADTSLCSNSENSTVTSHSSSKSPCLEDISNVSKDIREASEPVEDTQKTSASGGGNSEEVSGKHIKSAGNEVSNVELYSGKVSPAFPVTNVSGISLPATDPGSEVVTLRLVECSSEGLTSSCYLLKQRGESVRGFSIGEPNVSKSILLALEGNEGKEINTGNAIASPVSRDSIISRLFPPIPVVNAQVRSEHALQSPQDKSYEWGISDASVKEKLKKDPHQALKHCAHGLLQEAGWSIDRRKRPSRSYEETVYQPPVGKRQVREFAKAWRVCGETLCPSKCITEEEGDCKQWSDMDQFMLDFSNTLAILDKDANHSELAYKWNLLNPFVVVVLINRKVGALRKGEVVKAIKTTVSRKNGKGGGGGVTQKRAKGDLVISTSGSVLDGESNLIVFEANGCLNQTLSWPPTSLMANGTGSTVVQSTSCLCDVSLHQDGSTKCQICDKDSAVLNVGTVKEVGYVMNNNNGLLEFLDCPNNTTPGSVPFQGVDVVSQFCEGSKLQLGDLFTTPGDVSKKKSRRKSKKISEMKTSSLCQSGNPGVASADEANLPSANGNDGLLELGQDQGGLAENAGTGSRKKSSSLKSSSHQIKMTGSKLKRKGSDNKNSRSVKKKSKKCLIENDDWLVSPIIKNKGFSPGTSSRPSKRKGCKSKVRRKRKSQKRSCRLLPSKVDGQKHLKDGKWYAVGVRTVLSWLISTKVVSLNDVIEYRNPDDNAVMKDGRITRDGVLCKCCSKVFTVSAFKDHAGFNLNRPSSNLFMDSGKPFALCQFEAWCGEYGARNGGAPAVKVDNDDRNDDSCGLCGDGGELLCCDNCPSTFHQVCLSTQDLPEGNWYCSSCTCWICGSLVDEKDFSSPSYGLKCSQCEHKYHNACVKEKHSYQGAVSEAWCCSRSCQEVFSGLQSRVGVTNYVFDQFSWSLLKCIHDDDRKIDSEQQFALKAECNSRLSVALTIMQECFLSMVDPRTGIDMIPQVLYNWGSDFARLNFQGFYTVVLEQDDVLISVASIRVHGSTVAEMPLIATCSKYRRQGMCRILVNAIEEMLISVKVEKIVVAAIPDLVETWTKGFGFEVVDESEKRSLSKINFMVFPGTVLLKKTLYGDSSRLVSEPCPAHRPSDIVIDAIDVIGNEKEIVNCVSLEEEGLTGEHKDIDQAQVKSDSLPEQFSKMSSEDLAGELGSNVESSPCLYNRDDETQQPGCDLKAGTKVEEGLKV